MRTNSTSSDSSFEIAVDSFSPNSQSWNSNPSSSNSLPPSPSGSESSHSSQSPQSEHFSTFDQSREPSNSVTLFDPSTPPVSPLNVTLCASTATLPQSSVTLSSVMLSPNSVTFSPSRLPATFTPSTTVKIQPTIVSSPSIIKIVTLPQTGVTASHVTTQNVSVKVPIPKITKPGESKNDEFSSFLKRCCFLMDFIFDRNDPSSCRLSRVIELPIQRQVEIELSFVS